MVRTMYEEQCDALMDEFPEFSVWVDFRPMEEGTMHWHARQQGWGVRDIIHAMDAENMRRELIIWRNENATS